MPTHGEQVAIAVEHPPEVDAIPHRSRQPVDLTIACKIAASGQHAGQ
jgi:hypothetical protein